MIPVSRRWLIPFWRSELLKFSAGAFVLLILLVLSLVLYSVLFPIFRVEFSAVITLELTGREWAFLRRVFVSEFSCAPLVQCAAFFWGTARHPGRHLKFAHLYCTVLAKILGP